MANVLSLLETVRPVSRSNILWRSIHQVPRQTWGVTLDPKEIIGLAVLSSHQRQNALSIEPF